MTADIDATDAPNSIHFERVANVRISGTIVDQIRARIRSGELPVGARLPAERTLCDQFGVSRRTVREAFRMLEATGHISIKLGKEGGAFVTAPSASLVGEGLTDLISTAALSSSEVTEIRAIIETALLPLVCARANEADIDRLRALCDAHEAARKDGSYSVKMSLDFHRALAECTHNAAATLLLDAMRDSILKSLQAAGHGGTSGVAEHRRIVDAIAARNLDAATAEMAAHLDRTVRATAAL
ncbi:FadR/GntR family transcriptional regulator [Micromonospora sp. NPDC023966]|uniref:FadR/GntR family transcriptional regulator n=1 Tax=Micromonospora sp. NPDC023966 TaxID=3154699 RepID=UPI0033D6945E